METDNTEEHLRELVELTRLYDVYGSLLNDHKKEIFESYVLENYSLSEIAEQVGISRQGVRDIVRRCSKELMEIEAKLGFLKKMDIISGLAYEAEECLLKTDQPEKAKIKIAEIIDLINK